MLVMKHYSTGNISKSSKSQANTNIKLASQIEKYFFNNSICCFGCREFCIDQHYILKVPLNTDWLTRCHFLLTVILASLLFRGESYSYYHRHKRRFLCTKGARFISCSSSSPSTPSESLLRINKSSPIGFRQKIRKKLKLLIEYLVRFRPP